MSIFDTFPNMMRLRNVLPDITTGAYDQPDAPTVDTNDIRNIFDQYKPDHAMLDQLGEMLSHYPTRTPPTRGADVMGFLSSLGTGVHPSGIDGGQPIGFQGGNPEDVMKAGDLIRYRKYYEDMADWNNKLKPIEAGANVERYGNQNQRMLLNDIAAREIAQTRAQNQGRDINSKIQARTVGGQAQMINANARAATAALQQWKAEHPNHVFKEDDAGNVVAIDPQTNQAEYVRDPSGKAIKSAQLPGGERLQRIHLNKMAEIDEVGAQQRANTKLITEGKIETKAAPGPSAANESPTQRKARLQNNTKQALTDHPEWQQYVDPNDGVIKPPIDIDPDELAMIKSSVYGVNYNPSGQAGDIKLPPSGDNPPNGSKMTGRRVRIAGPDGKVIGTIDEADIPKLNPKYKVVK